VVRDTLIISDNPLFAGLRTGSFKERRNAPACKHLLPSRFNLAYCCCPRATGVWRLGGG